MKNIAILLPVLLLLGCNDQGVKGSGKLKSETRIVGNFSAIHLSGTGRLVVERTGRESLEITADDNILPLLTSELVGDTLSLRVAGGKAVSGKQPVYKITVADLRKIDLAGSGDIIGTKLEGPLFSVSIAGSGSATLSGAVDYFAANMSGSGSVNAVALVAKKVRVVVSGSGDMLVNATNELDATIAGSGSVVYVGDPKVKQSVAGSGTITRKPN
jgi:hypothetical protein